MTIYYLSTASVMTIPCCTIEWKTCILCIQSYQGVDSARADDLIYLAECGADERGLLGWQEVQSQVWWENGKNYKRR